MTQVKHFVKHEQIHTENNCNRTFFYYSVILVGFSTVRYCQIADIFLAVSTVTITLSTSTTLLFFCYRHVTNYLQSVLLCCFSGLINDGIGSVHRLAYSLIPDTGFGAVLDAFPILVYSSSLSPIFKRHYFCRLYLAYSVCSLRPRCQANIGFLQKSRSVRSQ